MAKQEKAQITSTLHDDGAVSHRVVFTNGETRVVLLKPGHALVQRFVAHGSKTKLLAAINSTDEVGKAVEKVDALDAAWGAEEPKWGLQNEGEGVPRAGALARALAELSGKPVEDMVAHVATLTRAQQAKLRATERVSALIAKYKAEDKKEEGGGDAMLDGLLGSSEPDAEEQAA